jgi:3-hydroxybutyryl-CoA dehydrogenase
VVEVVDGEMTAPWVADKLDAIARKCGHDPVRTQDTPGFLVNHAGRGLYTEGVRILAEGIAEAHQVDDVLREGGAVSAWARSS